MASEENIAQESVELRARSILLITGGVVVVTIAAIAVSGWMLRGQGASMRQRGEAERGSAPAMISAPISGVENSLYEVDQSGQAARLAQERAARQWGWQDRDAGVVSMPIERAMEWVVERNR